ncbi:MAG: hypothetical protein LBP76_14215 [Treponema sp.]|jgi:hypothetical protein|nr:hypothetical protein [Treponema sp.]
MRKLSLALLAACAVSLAAQEAPATPESILLNVGNYSKLFLNGGGTLAGKYSMVASANDYERIARLGGGEIDIDTPLEIALLSTCAGVIDVRPIEAKNMLPANDPRTADLKLGAAAYMDMQAARFMGNAPAPSAAALKFITDRGNATEADIKDFVKQGIAHAVDAEFNKIIFLLENSRTYSSARSHNARLTHDAKTGQYTLSYGGAYTNNETRTITANSLEALASEMRTGRYKVDFDEAGIKSVEANGALIPAAVFDGWKKHTTNMVNPYELLTQALANFYTTPNETNYKIVRGILARTTLADLVDGDDFTDYLWHSVSAVLASLNQGLYDKISKELWQNDDLISAAEIPNDPRYGIFTLTKAAGDEIFVSKKR